MSQNGSYRIELIRFQINNAGQKPAETTRGINQALDWARSEGYTHAVLPAGFYLVQLDPDEHYAIRMQSGLHLELESGCEIALQANTSPNYNIIEMRGTRGAKLSGGKITGDKKSHTYEIYVKFVRGGVNMDGTPNNDPKWIRSEVIDRYANPGLLANFRVWSMPGVNAPGYHFYQYKDTIAKETLVGYRTNGAFAPANPNGRGWFLNETNDMSNNNKMIIAIPLTTALTNQQIAALQAKIDHTHYTHESGFGVALYGCNHIEISEVEISHCTGDGIFTGWEQYHLDPAQYTQEQMGQHIRIHDCRIHHCRRQGISLTGSNDTHVYRNNIHDIGYDDDGVTTNFRNGTPPMFGIDIESMYGETNIPIKTPDRTDGLELNYRIHVSDNYIYNNVRGHLVNADGTYVTVEGNTFEGYNVGGIGANPNFPGVKYVDNTFIGCELSVQGDNYVNGAVFINGNLKLLDVQGAVVQNCQIKNGRFFGTTAYGYLGTPSVNAAAGTFTYVASHGIGNGAQVAFEQWIGKVPSGISVDKLYYTVNVTANSFQVSETQGGTPVALIDAGQSGFNISRFNYGRCYISDITLERDWRTDNALAQHFNLLTAGAVIKNVTVKNYDVSVMVPQDYAGRPTSIDGLTLIEGSARFEGCHINNAEFVRAKSPAMGWTDIQLGSNNARYTRQVTLRGGLLQNLGVMLDGNSLVNGTTFLNAAISKADNTNKAVIVHSHLDNTRVNLNWIRQNQSVTIAKSVFRGVTIAGTAPYLRLVDNTDLGSA
ncbi:right-handed parallel beta-helix repeat-containing protein [Paenibacillus arenilitoris]|uniref:Right-handed parallel beta-helix repeat-containing protein n=1 Tax=Paenibacillus arenilitoris TaxID=2772299 RepID=A0A927CRW2_9BACL|nr:right-handed parallel beta-helix repeat-containing protein [Paenibacillus arenilitoris]MBD2872032.1 right-handed parallel beta-helix repeat-containing protein [Paenibacillus arenilitoris]